MKILLNDGLSQEGVEILQNAGFETDSEKRSLDDLIQDIRNYDALVVRSATKVTPEVIEAGYGGKLKIIGRAGVGYDNIDIQTASEYGIPVANAPNGNTNAAAEHALGLMFAVSRFIPQSHYELKNGIWAKKQFKGIELSGRTLGILGCGRIGQRLSQLASPPFDWVIGSDLYPEKVKAGYPDSKIQLKDKEFVLKNADFVSIHTGGKSVIIGEKEIELMNENSILINVSRGENIDNETVYGALATGKIRGAGLDVYRDEGKEGEKWKNKYKSLDNIVLTSHLGANTQEAQRKTAIEMAEVIVNYLKNGESRNFINISDGDGEEDEKTELYVVHIHHEDEPGVFANITQMLASEDINIKDNSSDHLQGTTTAKTRFRLYQMPNEEILDYIRDLESVYSVIT